MFCCCPPQSPFAIVSTLLTAVFVEHMSGSGVLAVIVFVIAGVSFFLLFFPFLSLLKNLSDNNLLSDHNLLNSFAFSVAVFFISAQFCGLFVV